MNLSKFARRRYTDGQTPFEPVPRFSEALRGPRIFIKRDDMLGLAGGGNKTRKLEFLVADALAQGADTLITCGAVQSNHCRLTLAAARKEGLNCRLVLEERVTGSYKPQGNGNNFLFHLLGVETVRVVPGGSDMMAEMEKVSAELKQQGRKGYIIPGGGSNATGALGYVACAQELIQQAFEVDVKLDAIITTSGSAGTHAGLAVGFWGNRTGIPVIGINISRSNELQKPLVHGLAQKTADLLGIKDPLPDDLIQCVEGFVGPGYSLPTPEMIEAVKLLARTEAILLDPVYTGKAMAGLVSLCRKGFFKESDTVCFIHTGGAPALNAYTESFFPAL